MNVDDDEPILACRSEDLALPLAELRVVAGEHFGRVMPERGELIAAVRAGKHLELEASAITYRQRDGSPNRNHLRFSREALADVARSFVGVPVLTDHRQRSQGARLGTIVASELVDQGDGWSAFRQTLRVVKPDGVVSLLDGTLDRFSIGWSATGPVHCTAHRGRALVDCECWPGDKVRLEEGGTHVVEFEFQSAAGVETSGVNVPAVAGTRIESIRAALAAEIRVAPSRKESKMSNFPKIAAALRVSSAEDEAPALAAIAELHALADRERNGRLAAEQERDRERAGRLAAEQERDADRAARLADQVKVEIERAYREGRLEYQRDAAGTPLPSPREARLRRIAAEDGLQALTAEIAEMPVVVPIQRRVLTSVPEPTRADDPQHDALASVAKQLGLDPKDVAETAAAATGRGRGFSNRRG